MPLTLNEISPTDKYAFHSEWFDPEASMLRKFYLFYFPFDGAIEMYDEQRNKRFLKRTVVEGVGEKDIFVGNSIKIFSRQVKITDYANAYTENKIGRAMQKTFVLLKPDGVKNMSKIIRDILCNGFKITNLRLLKINAQIFSEMFSDKKESQDYPALMTYLTSAPILVMQVIGENGVDHFLKFAGPNDPKEAENIDPGCLRSKYGTDKMQNAVYCASTIDEAYKFNEYCFGKNPPPASEETTTAILKNSTCCIVKPHAVKKGYLGDIMQKIEEGGFTISAIQMFYIHQINAEEFYEIYKGVTQDYSDMVDELTSGACVAMEVVGPMGEETPKAFRTFVGPPDPDMARSLRPNCLRAIYGEDKIKNALHATDLPEDGILEVEYFFKIL